MLENGVMLQCFHWFSAEDGSHFRQLAEQAKHLASLGVTSVWLPPCYKGADGAADRGYAVYDLFDLGEFEQKGSRRTKYGTKEELLSAIEALHAHGIRAYADMVFNQRCGGDATEEVEAQRVNPDNRNEVSSGRINIKAWTRFDFSARGDTYSAMKWRAMHFTATDCNADCPDERQIYLLGGKTFSGEVSFEFGNFDFLMGCDVDTYHPQVFEELVHFGRWFVETTGVDGFRLDALKHVPVGFFKAWLGRVREHFPERELFAVGEYWSAELAELTSFLERSEGSCRLFDAPLHFRFFHASKEGPAFDLRTVFDGTLVQTQPLMAVTFVDNHDTQPGASLESWVEPWFKPLAYALVLLRREGYPCVFTADYFGHEDEHGVLHAHRVLLDAFLMARARYNYGDQHDYFDHPNCIAWLRTGDVEHPGAMVVMMSNGDAGTKRIETQKPNASFRDCTGHVTEPVHTDAQGAAEFTCPAGSLSVWLQE
jgi:alpha-amylase